MTVAMRVLSAEDKALAGALSLGHVGDRGLAYDLIGDNTRAQQDYAVALSAGPDGIIDTPFLDAVETPAGDDVGIRVR